MKNIFYIAILIFIIICTYGCIGNYLGMMAGSYPYAETWNFKVNEKELIDIIKDFKLENPSVQPPNDTALTIGKHNYWYFINFYDKVNKETIHTWIRENNDSNCTFALVYFSDRSIYSKNKYINRDYWYFKNKRKIKKFKTEIIDKLQAKVALKNSND